MSRVLILSLAVLRLTRLVILEDGPFDLFAKLRNSVDPKQATWVGRGLHCFYCVSFWLGLALALIYGRKSKRRVIVDGLAASGGAALIRFVLFKDNF